MESFTLLGLPLSSVSAVIVSSAAVTAAQVVQTEKILTHALLPVITTPPAVAGPRRRQNIPQTLIGAPDNTCGFFNGSSGLPWGCSTDSYCVFASPSITASTTIGNVTVALTQTVGSVICCDTNSACTAPAPAPTACVANGQNEFNATCIGDCLNDPTTLKCTSKIYLFCNTVAFATPSISAVFCNYISNDAVQTASTVYLGQTSHDFTPTPVQFAVSSTSHQVSSGTESSTSVSTDTSTPTATLMSKKNVNKPAIIGGVIGGAVTLAFGIFALVMVTRWFRPEYLDDNKGKEKVPPAGTETETSAIEPKTET